MFGEFMKLRFIIILVFCGCVLKNWMLLFNVLIMCLICNSFVFKFWKCCLVLFLLFCIFEGNLLNFLLLFCIFNSRCCLFWLVVVIVICFCIGVNLIVLFINLVMICCNCGWLVMNLLLSELDKLMLRVIFFLW